MYVEDVKDVRWKLKLKYEKYGDQSVYGVLAKSALVQVCTEKEKKR